MLCVVRGWDAERSRDDDLDELIQLMLPRSAAPSPSSWEEVEESTGLRYSDALRAFLETYGPGLVGGELMVFDPRHPTDFQMAVADYGASVRIDREWSDRPDGAPYDPWPASGTSLLVVAADGSGEAVFATVHDGVVDDGELWLSPHDGRYHRISGPLTRLVLSVLRGDPPPAVAGDGLWALRPIYIPWWPGRPTPVLPPDGYGTGKGEADDLLRHAMPAPLDLLEDLVPPPERPTPFPLDWTDVEERLDLRCPPDLCALVDRYGDGVAYPIDWLKPRSRTAEDVIMWNAQVLERSPLGGSAPMPAHLPGDSGLLPVASSRLGSERVWVEVHDGVADDAQLWVSRPAAGDWVRVPGPLTALLVAALGDVDRWGLAQFHPY